MPVMAHQWHMVQIASWLGCFEEVIAADEQQKQIEVAHFVQFRFYSISL